MPMPPSPRSRLVLVSLSELRTRPGCRMLSEVGTGSRKGLNMTEQPRDTRRDDTEGHGLKFGADAERAEGDADTEGHGVKFGADAERAEDDDVEGHRPKPFADAERSEDDDVAGHMQPPPDLHRDR